MPFCGTITTMTLSRVTMFLQNVHFKNNTGKNGINHPKKWNKVFLNLENSGA